MSALKKQNFISVEQYLQDELTREFKHELIDGDILAMAGASVNHERISGNLQRGFGNHLEGSPCEPFGSDMKVKVGSNFFYPDVLVDCSFDESEPYFTKTPVIIVEVLSKSTRKKDKSDKKMAYFNIPTLNEYVVIEQDYCEVEVFRRKNSWKSDVYFLEDSVTFEAIDLTLSVEDIYRRVNNDDMVNFLNEKKD